MKLFIKKNYLLADNYKAQADVFFKRWYDQKDKIIEWLKVINQVVLMIKFIIEILKIIH